MCDLVSRNLCEILTRHGTVCKVPVTLLPTYHPICSSLCPSCGPLPAIQAADPMSGYNHRHRASSHKWKAKRNRSPSKQSHSATPLRPKLSVDSTKSLQYFRNAKKSWASQMLSHSEGKKNIPMSVGLLGILDKLSANFWGTGTRSFTPRVAKVPRVSSNSTFGTNLVHFVSSLQPPIPQFHTLNMFQVASSLCSATLGFPVASAVLRLSFAIQVGGKKLKDCMNELLKKEAYHHQKTSLDEPCG